MLVGILLSMGPLHVMGEFAFVIGIILAVVMGFFSDSLNSQAMTISLIALGFAIGLLSITDKESDKFLVASIALLLAGAAGLQTLPVLGEFVNSVFTNIITLVAPAAMIVAIKSLYNTAAGGGDFIRHIIKRDGTVQVFMREKIERSCLEAGASKQLCKTVADDVSRKVRSGMTSRHVAELVHSSLKKQNARVASSFMKKMSRKGAFRVSH